MVHRVEDSDALIDYSRMRGHIDQFRCGPIVEPGTSLRHPL